MGRGRGIHLVLHIRLKQKTVKCIFNVYVIVNALYNEKKKNKYKEIQNGAVAKSYIY
jgi:hypothetical protein